MIYEGVNYGRVLADFNQTHSDPFTGDNLYTAAMQTEDGYTPGDPVWVRVCKLSNVGRGHSTTARI